MSGFTKEKLLVTGTEGAIGVMREVKGEEPRYGDEERVKAMEEVIMNEGMMKEQELKKEGKRIECIPLIDLMAMKQARKYH